MRMREVYQVESSVWYAGNAPSIVLELTGVNTSGKTVKARIDVDPCIVEAIVTELRKTTTTIADRWRFVERVLGKSVA